MRFSLWKSAAVLVFILVALCLSCEQHHAGELEPERRPPGGEAAANAQNAPAQEAKDQNRDGSPTPAISPTPVNFFPPPKNP